MVEDFKYDVFISYSHKDEEWVVNILLPALEDAGLRVCIDFRDFTPGKLSRHNMRDACKESAYTILVMSPCWMASEWTMLESLLSFLHDPAGKRQRTVPILLEKCDIPDDIQIFTYIDFTRKDRETIAWTRLFAALGKPNVFANRKLFKTSAAIASEGWFFAHPYGMSPNFTGRYAERNMLTGWLNADKDHPLLILRALGGFGKSALSWYWLTNDVDEVRWTKVVWWSFYEGNSSFEDFLAETLRYIDAVNVKQMNPHQQMEMLLHLLHRPDILLVLDGFERALRAFDSIDTVYMGDKLERGEDRLQDNSRDCINPYANTFLRSIAVNADHLHGKILMTTRLTPRAVEHEYQMLYGCLEVELASMNKADAVSFFRARGVRGPGAEIEDICAAYGYHPLSLRLLAGLIMSSSENSRDIAVARKLDITDDIVQNKHHVLEHTYNSLTKAQQTLLSEIACFRSSIDYKVLQVIVGKMETFDDDIQVLVEHGLLHHAELINKFDLHPIVRRYSYDRLTTLDKITAHAHLVDYFKTLQTSKKVEKLEDLAPVIELYHHTVKAGRLNEAVRLFYNQLRSAMYYQFGAYQLYIELLRALFPEGEDKLPSLRDESAQAWTLNELANSYALSGQPRRAVPLLEMHNAIYEKVDDKKNLAIGLGNVAAMAQIYVGALNKSERNLCRRIDLSLEIADEHSEAIGHHELGRVLSYRGEWKEAEQELDRSLRLAKKEKHSQMQAVIWSYRTLRFLLMAREEAILGTRKSNIEYLVLAIESVQRALEFADKHGFTRDYIRAYWLLGVVNRANNKLTMAEENLSKALNLCRQINLVESEADILLDLARLRYAQGDFQDAQEKASEALVITERSGYVLQGADVNLFLAQYALEQEKDKAKAKAYAESALKLAYCDGPPYYYKVAYEEAEQFLEKLAG